MRSARGEVMSECCCDMCAISRAENYCPYIYGQQTILDNIDGYLYDLQVLKENKTAKNKVVK
jgi:hypothetical protein